LPSAITRRPRRARQQHDDHQRREGHHAQLPVHDREHERALLVLRELPDRVRGPVAARIEDDLRRGDPELLADQRDRERQQPVEDVQAGRLVPGQHQRAPEQHLHDDHHLPGPEHAPEPGTRCHPPPAPGAVDSGHAVQRDREHPDDEVDLLHRVP